MQRTVDEVQRQPRRRSRLQEIAVDVRATSPGSLVRRDASQEVRVELRAWKGW